MFLINNILLYLNVPTHIVKIIIRTSENQQNNIWKRDILKQNMYTIVTIIIYLKNS